MISLIWPIRKFNWTFSIQFNTFQSGPFSGSITPVYHWCQTSLSSRNLKNKKNRLQVCVIERRLTSRVRMLAGDKMPTKLKDIIHELDWRPMWKSARLNVAFVSQRRMRCKSKWRTRRTIQATVTWCDRKKWPKYLVIARSFLDRTNDGVNESQDGRYHPLSHNVRERNNNPISDHPHLFTYAVFIVDTVPLGGLLLG